MAEFVQFQKNEQEHLTKIWPGCCDKCLNYTHHRGVAKAALHNPELNRYGK